MIVGLLSAAGVILSHTVHPNLWLLKKVANSLASIPVLRTLRQYNSVTTVGLHINGRGNVLSQSLMLVEYWNIVIQILVAVGYAYNRGIPEDEYNEWDEILLSFRSISFAADWTQVLMHAIFMNVLDELHSLNPQEHESQTTRTHPSAAMVPVRN